MSYPGALPSFAGFTAGHTLAADNHAAQHNLEQSEIVAIATKIGTGASTPVASTFLKGTGTGTSAWQAVDMETDLTGILPVDNGGTGVNTSTGSGSVVLSNSPTLVTPTIGSFTSAQHDHANAAGGGVLANNAVATAMIQDDAVTPPKAGDLLKAVNRQDDTTNSVVTDQLIQSGWGYISNTAARSVGETVTFPVAFDDVPLVVANFLGLRTGSVPTGPGTSNAGYYDVVHATAAVATTTTVVIQVSYLDATNLPAGYSIYNWIAIGTKAR